MSQGSSVDYSGIFGCACEERCPPAARQPQARRAADRPQLAPIEGEATHVERKALEARGGAKADSGG